MSYQLSVVAAIIIGQRENISFTNSSWTFTRLYKINSVLKPFSKTQRNLLAECDRPGEDDVQAHWPESIMGKMKTGRRCTRLCLHCFHPSHRLSRDRLSAGRRLYSTDPPLTSTPPTNAPSTNPHGMLYAGPRRDAMICAVSGTHSCLLVIGRPGTEPPHLFL